MNRTVKIFFLILLMSCCHVLSFEPPVKKERIKAVGYIKRLSLLLQKAFSPDDCFKIIPVPGPADWLANHKESGETYSQFLKKRYPKPRKGMNVIYIQPLGKFDNNAPDLNLLKEYAAIYFCLPVILLPPLKKDDFSFTKRINSGTQKEQLLSTDILAYLYKRKPEDAYLILGVTMSDLYPEESWNFVFGQASYSRRSGVFSFARYHPEFYGDKYEGNIKKLILKRSLGVMVHEMGHMFGLPHCIYYDCQMNGANNLNESDSKPFHICPICLRKLHHQTGFNIIERYKKMHEFYVKNGFAEGVKFTKNRLQKLVPGFLKNKNNVIK